MRKKERKKKRINDNISLTLMSALLEGIRLYYIYCNRGRI